MFLHRPECLCEQSSTTSVRWLASQLKAQGHLYRASSRPLTSLGMHASMRTRLNHRLTPSTTSGFVKQSGISLPRERHQGGGLQFVLAHTRFTLEGTLYALLSMGGWSSLVSSPRQYPLRPLRMPLERRRLSVGSTLRPAAAWRSAAIEKRLLDTPTASATVARNFAIGRGWALPRIVSWSARALFHCDPFWRGQKLDHLRFLAGKADILCIQEAHVPEQGPCTVAGLDETFFVFHSALNFNGSAGGILCLVRRSYAVQVRLLWDEVVAGRICKLTLQRGQLERHFVVAHITPQASQSWDHLCRMAVSALPRQHVGFIIGDMNVSSELGEQVHVRTGEPVLHYGPRTALWRTMTKHLELIPCSLSHENKARAMWTAIDKVLCNFPRVLVEVA
eukprot:3048255-Amphidinium_carterae.1